MDLCSPEAYSLVNKDRQASRQLQYDAWTAMKVD